MNTPFPDLSSSTPANDGVTRINAGSVLDGRLVFEGSVLLAGELRGHLRINGRLVILPGGVASGRLRVSGDVSVLGTLGQAPGDDVPETILECPGWVQLDAHASGHGTVLSPHFSCDPNADWLGQHVATHQGMALPTLKDRVAVPVPIA